MKTYKQSESGLLVPAEAEEPPEPASEPPSKYGPLELLEFGERQDAAVALSALWDAMGLAHGWSSVIAGESERWEAHYQAYRYIGEMLIGDDLPDHEVCT